MHKFFQVVAVGLLAAWAYLSLSRPIGVTEAQAKSGVENQKISLIGLLISDPFPLGGIYEKLGYGLGGTGEITLRILGMLTLAGMVTAVTCSISARLPDKSRWAVILSAANLPWLYILSLNHLGEALTVCGLGWYLHPRISTKTKWFLLLVMGWSSLPGWIGAVLLSLWQLWKKQKVYLILLLVLSGWAVWHGRDWQSLINNDFTAGLKSTSLAAEINRQRKYIFLSAGKSEVMPAWVGKMTYNKAVFAAETVIKKSVSAIDPTLWTAAAPAWVITRLSGIPPKGVWPVLEYWQVLAAAAALAGSSLSASAVWLGIVGIMPIILADPVNINAAGALLIPGIVYLIAKATVTASRKSRWWAWGFLGINVVGWGYFTRQIFFTPETVIDTRVISYRRIFDLYRDLPKHGQKLVITNRQGPTQTMFEFYNNGLPPEVTFEAFDWPSQPAENGVVYMGFTGEFAGLKSISSPESIPAGKILNKTELPDEIVHNFGKTIWVATK